MDLIPHDLNQGNLNNKSMTYDLFYTMECELQEHKGHTFVVWLFEFIKNNCQFQVLNCFRMRESMIIVFQQII